MEQLKLTYFWPLTEQIALDLDYKPCYDYEEEKKRSSVNQNGLRLDMWNGVNVDSTGNIMLSNTMLNPTFVIYPDKCPITIKTENKPNILARWIYKILGAKWEKA